MKSLDEIRESIRVTKVVSTRSVKTKIGDTYAGFTASWDCVQDDDPSGDKPSQPLTIGEAKIAHLMLAKETDLAAHKAAKANGSLRIEDKELPILLKAISSSYDQLILDLWEG